MTILDAPVVIVLPARYPIAVLLDGLFAIRRA